LTIPADIAIREQAEAAIERAVQTLGAPRLLVTSAGVARPGLIDELTVDVFERAMAVNCLGTVYAVKAALPHMRGREAHIVLISSGAGLIGLYGYAAYSASKFALRGFAEALHAELRHSNIGVSIAYPPDTDTPQLAEENLTKPAETRMMTGAAGVWSAGEVADCILEGVRQRRFAITPGFQLTVLYRLGSLLAPLLQRYWAWRVARLRRCNAHDLAGKSG
jgi:3-dehydrosphinganine reductase